MGICLPGISRSTQILPQFPPTAAIPADTPKGHIAVYVGDRQKKRFVIPVSYLNHPSFKDLLRRAEEEFGFHHPMGGLTLPCNEAVFIDLTSRLNST